MTTHVLATEQLRDTWNALARRFDNTFDVSASQNGVSVLPELSGALREIVRVTKPGGRVLIVAFGAPGGLTDEQRADVRHALDGMLRDDAALRTEMNIGIGTKGRS